jgi:hypothetical protein
MEHDKDVSGDLFLVVLRDFVEMALDLLGLFHE